MLPAPLLFLLASPEATDTASWGLLPVAMECQSEARVDACVYVRGFLENLPVLTVVPRSAAKLVVYVNVSHRGENDLVYLRAIGDIPGAPVGFDQSIEIYTRLEVDEQRAALQPVLARLLAPYVSITAPGAVSVIFSTPGVAVLPARTTPWSWSTWFGGSGSWTEDYQHLSGWTGVAVKRGTEAQRHALVLWGSRSISRQPSIQVGESEVALATDASALGGYALAAWNLDERWTVGAMLRGGHNDPEGPYFATARAHAGVERNLFAARDPRGNRLAIAYLLGAQADGYNHVNTLGEERAVFPSHMLLAGGSVRMDRTVYNLDFGAQSELLHPLRRLVLSGQGDARFMVGKHVDLTLGVGVARQEIPGPAEIDASNYEEVIRASYAEPLRIWGNTSLSVHWDSTNGAVNNRFANAESLGSTDNL